MNALLGISGACAILIGGTVFLLAARDAARDEEGPLLMGVMSLVGGLVVLSGLHSTGIWTP